MAVLSHLSSTGTPKESDILSVVGSFPVAGLAWWQDDWHAYRCCPYPHVHTGVDMFAETGTPLVAVADGTVTQRAENPISGLGVEIQDAAGAQYFYAHLSAFASGLSVGQAVKTGQVIGYVGNTGNAAGTSPHLHFEVQPNGIPVPPIPYVNRWLGEAESRAFLLLEEDFSFAITPADLAKWQELAAQLAGNATPGSEGSAYGGNGAGGSDGTLAGLAGLDGNDPVRMAVGPMVVFVAMAYLFLLIAPGVRAGRRDTLSTIVAETRAESAEKPVVSPA